MFFINVLTAGLFFVVNIISVSSVFKFNHCKPMDPVKRATYCFFDYNHIGESLRDEHQNVTLCFKPKDSFSKLLVHHFQVKEPASYEIYSDFFETDKWNFFNVTIIFRKGITASYSDTIQYIFNGKPDKKLSLPKTLNIFEFNVGFTFLGEIEGRLNDLLPCSFPSREKPEYEIYFFLFFFACIASLLIFGVFGSLALIQFSKIRKLRMEFAKECQKMRNFKELQKQIPENLYVDPNVTTKDASTSMVPDGTIDQMDQFSQQYDSSKTEEVNFNKPTYILRPLPAPGIYLNRPQNNETKEIDREEPFYSDIIYPPISS